VLVYGFNSAIVSGSRLTQSDSIRKATEWLREYRDPAGQDKIATVLEALDSASVVDPARIDPRELDLFDRFTNVLRDRLGEEYDRALKIAVLHHHVLPMRGEEVKQFDLLLNAGRFKAELCAAGFQLVAHGHRHDPGALVDSAVPGGGVLIVIAGGTIGGGEARGSSPGFNWIEYSGNDRALTNRYIELSETGNAGQAWNRASVRRFRVPSSPTHSEALQHIFFSVDRPKLDVRNARRNAGRSLMSFVQEYTSPTGQSWVGWCHMLGEDCVSIAATAIGLKLMKDAGYTFEVFRGDKMVETLMNVRLSDGLWSGSSQQTGWPEATSYVTEALYSWGYHGEAADAINALEANLLGDDDAPIWKRTSSLATTLQMLSLVAPNSELLDVIARTLLAARVDSDDGSFWGRLTDRDRATKEASVVHTARAVTALVEAYHATDGAHGISPSTASTAANWLLAQPEWSDDEERIYRQMSFPGKQDSLLQAHFADPWVLRALLAANVDPSIERLAETAARLYWRQDDEGLWPWHGRSRPIWVTADALDSLTQYALKAAPLYG